MNIDSSSDSSGDSSDKDKAPAVPQAAAEEVTWTAVPMDGPVGLDLFDLHRRPVAHSEAEYAAAVLSYIRLKYKVRNLGCPLADLNRRFSSLSKMFGIPVSAIVKLHVGAHEVAVTPHRGNLIAFPMAEWDALTSDLEHGIDAVTRICDDSLRDIGKVIVDKKKAAPKRSSFY